MVPWWSGSGGTRRSGDARRSLERLAQELAARADDCSATGVAAMSGAIDRFSEAARARGLQPEVRRFPEGTKTARRCRAGDRMRRRPDREVAGLHGRRAARCWRSPSGRNRVDEAKLASLVGAGAVRRATPEEARDPRPGSRWAAPRRSGTRSAVTCFVDHDLLGVRRGLGRGGNPGLRVPAVSGRPAPRERGHDRRVRRRLSERSAQTRRRLSWRPAIHPTSPEEPMITLTENAAGKVKELLAEEGRDDIALRVAVRRAGAPASGTRCTSTTRSPRRTQTAEQFGVTLGDRQDERAVPVAGHHRLRGLARAVGLHDRQPRRPGRLRLRQLVPLSRAAGPATPPRPPNVAALEGRSASTFAP